MPTDYTILQVKQTAPDGFPGFPDHVRSFDRPRAWRGGLEIAVRRESLDPDQLLALRRDRSVVGVAPIMPTRLIAPVSEPAEPVAPAPPKLAASWGVQEVSAVASRRDGAGVCVAVLDTGIDRTHPAFAGVEIVESNFTGSEGGDRVGHGTHCAGIIFGRDVGGVRIGVARGVARVLIGKVLGDHGAGTSDAVMRGVRWAIEHRAQVISLSLGLDFPGMVEALEAQGLPTPAAISQTLVAYRANLRLFDAMMDLLRAQASAGEDAVVIAAAGNDSRRPDYTIAASLPAAAVGMIAVGAAERGPGGEIAVAAFSNTFPQVCAPGARIVSARAGGGLVALSGTSMATPHVAGVAALHWQALGRDASAVRVAAALIATARSAPFAGLFTPADYGAGLVTAPV